MNKLDNPRFRYYTKAESEQPGYLEKRMEFYKEMVKHEQDRTIYQGPQDSGVLQGHHGSFYGQQNHSKPNAQFFVVGQKG